MVAQTFCLFRQLARAEFRQDLAKTSSADFAFGVACLSSSIIKLADLVIEHLDLSLARPYMAGEPSRSQLKRDCRSEPSCPGVESQTLQSQDATHLIRDHGVDNARLHGRWYTAIYRFCLGLLSLKRKILHLGSGSGSGAQRLESLHEFLALCRNGREAGLL